MKKNLVIMLMMVLCAGFASAQTVSTVRGFVPGGSTGAMNNDTYATYATFGQPFATMVNNNGHEVTVGLAQMQLVTDSITDVVTCGQGYHKHGFDLTEEELQELLVQCENEGQRGYLRSQKPNVAVQDYYYDSLVVIDLYVCPCTTTVENEEYEVIALNGECWFKENMRNNFAGSMLYTSELNSVDPADPEQLKTFGRLYTYEATISGAEVCEDGEIQGICPEKWHLPTVDEVDPLFTLPAENLRVDGHWIVDGNNNMTEFSAQPAGYYNSISQRFEGMLTETDFWMVDCDNLNPEDNQLPVLQLIYSCNTPLKPNRPKEDAISVRCVYNIVKHLEDCDPNLNPEPTPIPDDVTCPTVDDFSSQVTADGVQISFNISNYEGKLDNQHVDSENPDLVGSVLGHYYINLRQDAVDPGADESGPIHFYVLPESVEPLLDAPVPTLQVIYIIPFGDTFNPSTIASIYPAAEVYLIDSLEECGDGGILYPDGDVIPFQQ